MNEITKKAKRLAELRATFPGNSAFEQFKKQIAEENKEEALRIFAEQFEMSSLEVELQNEIEGKYVVEVDDVEARAVLDSLAEKNSKRDLQTELSEYAWPDELEFEWLWSWLDPGLFLTNYAAIQTMVSVVGLPSELQTIVEEARRCYACGMENAVASLARTIVEFTITDIGVTLGRFPRRTTKELFKVYPPYERANIIIGSGNDLRRRFDDLYYECSEVIHGTSINQKMSGSMLCQALKLTAELYAIHHSSYRAARERQSESERSAE